MNKLSQQNNQKLKILVVGAGLAGLTAARSILCAFNSNKSTQPQSSQIQIHLFQALDRVGGRTYTIQLRDTVYDLGAEYIGKTQKYALQLAKQSQLQLYQQNVIGKKILDFNNKPFDYSNDLPLNVGTLGLLEVQWVLTKLDMMAKKINVHNPKQHQLAVYWDSMTLADWLRKNVWGQKVRKLIQLAIRSIFAVDLSQISMLYFLWYIKQNQSVNNLVNVKQGLQEYKTKKGTQHMSLFLHQKIQQMGGKIHFKTKISQVHQNDCQVTIISQKGQKYTGNYLIMACPTVQLKKILFQPLLSVQKRFLINKAFMGLSTKVIVLYEKQYWQQKGFSGEILSDCQSSPILCAYDETKMNNKGQLQPALFTFVNGGVYREWTTREDMERAIVKKFAEYFKCEEMLNPLDVKWFQWDQEISIGGGYAGVYSPGTLTGVGNFSLRQPEGLIHWAGTETALSSIGYMDGAIQSGKRVSKQLMQTIRNKQRPSAQKLIRQTESCKTSNKDRPWYSKLLHTGKFFEWL